MVVFSFSEEDSSKINALMTEISALETDIDLKKAERETRQKDYDIIERFCRKHQEIWGTSSEPEQKSPWELEQEDRQLFFDTLNKYDFVTPTGLHRSIHLVDLLSQNHDVRDYCLKRHIRSTLIDSTLDALKTNVASVVLKKEELRVLYEKLIGVDL